MTSRAGMLHVLSEKLGIYGGHAHVAEQYGTRPAFEALEYSCSGISFDRRVGGRRPC